MTTVAKTEKKKTGPDPAREVDGRQCATHEEGRRGGCGRSNSSNSSGGEALRDHGPISKKGRGLAGWNAGGHEGEREVFLSLSLVSWTMYRVHVYAEGARYSDCRAADPRASAKQMGHPTRGNTNPTVCRVVWRLMGDAVDGGGDDGDHGRDRKGRGRDEGRRSRRHQRRRR